MWARKKKLKGGKPVSDRVRQALAEALASGEVDTVIMHRETEVPAEVAEVVVEQGVQVYLAGEEVGGGG